jgi:Tfp pilus assembly protein PilN
MNAVNLIPPDQRRGGGTGGGWASYALLGGLALVLVAVAAYVVTSNQISQRKDDLAAAKQRAATATGQLAALQPYVEFASLERARMKTVHDLAASRFDWERAMGGLARVTSREVWLTSMLGTVAPGVAVGDAGGGAGGDSDLRDAEAAPAVELSGCGTSNTAIVSYLSRLRALTGVTRVTLADAQKPDDTAGSTGSSSGSSGGPEEGCGPDPHVPAFHVIVFFRAPAPLAAAPTPAGETG